MKMKAGGDWTARTAREMAPRTLASLLGEWSSGGGPLYRQLAQRLRALVDQGELTEGTRLPPERLLARALAVSRTTVVGAYDQLRAETLLASRQGSGTWVERPASRSSAAPQPKHAALARFLSGTGATIDLLGAHLPGMDGIFAAALASSQDDLQELTRASGYFPMGLPALRRAIATLLTKAGLASREEEILVTSGAQQAITLAACSLVRPGDVVVLEDPTYVGAIDAFRSASARIVTVPVGPDGVSPATLRDTIVRNAARLVYLMPTFQNPTGTVIPENRRREIARLVRELRVPLLEDHTLSNIVLQSPPPPPPIASFAKDAPVITVGSMSKLFWAGLRVGWMRAPEALLAPVVHCKVVSDMGSSVPSQCLAVHVMEQFEKVKRSRRHDVTAALGQLTGLLKTHLPTWTYTRPRGGLVLWLRLPEGDANELAQVALRHGVSIVPGPITSPHGLWTDYIRMPIETHADVLRDGIERLARAWQAYRGGSPRREREVEVIV
jgi:DNA-binding transcriptional MocR family regulator